MWNWLDLWAAAAGTLTVGLSARAVSAFRDLPDLPDRNPSGPGRLRIVVPSRESGPELIETLRRLLASTTSFELVVVDDRSAEPLAARLPPAFTSDARLRIERVDELPPGFLGKPNACARGASGFDGDWLLFLDDDSWTQPDFIPRLLAEAESTGADHFCLLPTLRDTTWTGRVLVASMAFGMLQRIHGMESDRRGPGFGVGACTLVRRSCYEALGGHAERPLAVLEDIRLAEHVRAEGYRSRIRIGTEVVSVSWITDWTSSFRLLQKNWFAAFGYRWSVLLTAVVLSLLVWGGTVAGPILGTSPVARALATLGLLAAVLTAALHARRVGWSPWVGLGAPLAQPLIPAAMCWSALKITRERGVRWRGAFYPLDELRAAERG